MDFFSFLLQLENFDDIIEPNRVGEEEATRANGIG